MERSNGLKKATAAAMSVVMAASLNMPIVAVADEGEQEDPASQTTQVDPLEGESVPPAQEDETSVSDEAEDEAGRDAEDVASSGESSTNSISLLSADPEDTGSEEGQTTGVAMIDNTPYSTLADAIADVPTDGEETTITLANDAEVSANLQIPSGKNIKLNLAGHTVHVTKGYILVRGKLTVVDDSANQDGAIIGKEGCSGFNVIQVNETSASLVLESGALKSEKKTVVQCNRAGATFEMKGGSVKSELPVTMSYGSVANIQGGTIQSSDPDGTAIELVENTSGVQPPQPKLIVGEAENYEQPVIEGMIKTESSIHVELNGGTIGGVTGHLSEDSVLTSRFGSDISAALPSGKTCVEQNGQYVVKDGVENSMVEIVSSDGAKRSYASLASAMVYLQDGETLKLLQDVETSEPLNIDRKISATIDLNGRTLTSTSEKAALIVDQRNVDITVKNGSIVSNTPETGASIIGIYGSQFTSDDCTLTLIGVTLSTANENANAGLIVSGDNVNDTVTLQSCTINVPETVMGIYFPPAQSTLNIVDTRINAGTGIGIKGGTLNVSGSTSITATGERDTTSVGPTGGIQETGDAIYVEGDYTNRAISVNIVGGVFSSAQGKAINLAKDEGRTESIEPIKFAVSGGSFSSNVSEYLADGYEMATQIEDGSDIETYVPLKHNVVAIGENKYMSLEEAIGEASDGVTITLLENVTTEPLTISKSINLNLGGHTLTLDGEGDPDEVGLLFTAGASMITNGTIYDGRAGQRTTAVAAKGGETSLSVDSASVLIEIPKQKYDVYGMRVLDGASLTLGSGASIAEKKIDGREGYSYGVVVLGNSSNAVFNPETATNLTINDGASITSNAFAVSGNGGGTQHNTNIVVNGGTLESEIGCAIYHPQYGKLTVNGGTIQGVSGIEMRSGEIEVTGGTIIGGHGELNVIQNGGGSTTDNAALAVMQHSTKLPIAVEIKGGKFEGTAAFVQNNPMGNDDDAIDKITLSIEGGSFDGQVIADNFNGEGEGFISGGTFSNLGDGATLDELLAEGFKAESGSDGSVTVSAQYVAQVGGKPYETVQAAINAATSDASTVQLLANTVESIVIPSGKTITLDLAGHTITNVSGSDTITVNVNGTLVVDDTVEGNSGIIDNVSNGKAALVVNELGNATLKGGKLCRSQEAGTLEGNAPNGNSYYTILNHGALEISDDAVIELMLPDGTPAGYSSVIDNGWFSGKPETEGYNATLTVNGGTIRGGKYLKNDSYGKLIINSGNIVDGANASILNWNEVEINGGIIDPSDGAVGAVYNLKDREGAENGAVAIKGGTFKLGDSQQVAFTDASGANVSHQIAIEGGTFTGVLNDQYFADGVGYEESAESEGAYEATALDDGQYLVGKYKVNANDPSIWTYPSKDGQVFAGWYSDAGYTKPYADTSGPAYAKFVDENVLQAKCQVPASATVDDDLTRVRLLSSVDALDYQDVGFVLRAGDNEAKTYSTTTVYEEIQSQFNDGVHIENPNAIFCESSKWFTTVTIANIGKQHFDTWLHITPYWTTSDGTKVTGQERVVTVAELIEMSNTAADQG